MSPLASAQKMNRITKLGLIELFNAPARQNVGLKKQRSMTIINVIAKMNHAENGKTRLEFHMMDAF